MAIQKGDKINASEVKGRFDGIDARITHLTLDNLADVDVANAPHLSLIKYDGPSSRWVVGSLTSTDVTVGASNLQKTLEDLDKALDARLDAISTDKVDEGDHRLIDDRYPLPHTHPISEITGLQGLLDLKGNLNGANFTGQVRCPTPSSGATGNQIVTTAWVKTKVDAALSGSGGNGGTWPVGSYHLRATSNELGMPTPNVGYGLNSTFTVTYPPPEAPPTNYLPEGSTWRMMGAASLATYSDGYDSNDTVIIRGYGMSLWMRVS